MSHNDIDELIPHLYISNWYASNNPSVLYDNNIRAVITLETRSKPQSIIEFYNKNKIDYAYINIGDSPNENIYKYFDPSYDFIQKHITNHENVLIHCYAGISRSSTIILNYLLRRTFQANYLRDENPKIILSNVLNFVKKKRNIINPNPGFLQQLFRKTQEYQKMYIN